MEQNETGENRLPKTEPQPSVQEETKGCTGNCKLCTNDQRIYCASQIGFYVNNAIGQIAQAFDQQSKAMAALNGKLDDLLCSIDKIAKDKAAAADLMNAPEPPVADKKPSKKGGKPSL